MVSFSAIFTIVNPLGAVGPFIGMTVQDNEAKRESSARRACWLATSVLFMCAALGGFFFQMFGITLPALKIAGGSLLFIVGMDMINARESRARSTEEETKEGAHKEDIAVFPLGIPLLCGPGAIVSIFMLVDQAKNIGETLLIYVSVAATMVISYLLLRQASRVARILGATGINVMSRLMGLVLAAVAVQFIMAGLLDSLPGLRGLPMR
ncbi:MAG: antibiotic resistance protein MarC [Bdellovibrio sp.]|nr:MAG: antibiotic resistance protein MarC [Bdellovibrio sp.]